MPRRLTSLVVLSLVTSSLLAACSGRGSPTPSSTPTATPTPAGSGGVEHPTGSDQLVLRLEQGGGFVMVDFLVTQAPLFSLYGDGTVVYQAIDTRAAPIAGPLPFRKAALDEAQMGALLGFALGQGGLGEAGPFYGSDTCADCLTTTFTINAGGLQKTVEAYALGFDPPGSPDAPLRARLAQLAELLRSFETQVAAGKATDAGTYEPPAYRAILAPAQGVPDEVVDWPWADVALDDFVARPGDPFTDRRYAVLTPAQARLLAASPEGGAFPVAVTGPDEAIYTIGLRPLLPDENT